MLAIGSILYLKEGSQKLMVISRNMLAKENDIIMLYDYMACKYPVGYDVKQSFYFNEENIDRVVFHGYMDEDEERITELFTQWRKQNVGKYTKGKVELHTEQS